MEDCSDKLNPLVRKDEASRIHKLSSRKGHYRSTKPNKLHLRGKKPPKKRITENACSGRESCCQSIPIEDQVLKNLKKERRLLKKWTLELSKVKNEKYPDGDIADESSSVGSKMSEIQKRYQILLPAIKLAMETMKQAAIAKSSLNPGAGIKSAIKDRSHLKSTGLVRRQKTRCSSTRHSTKATGTDDLNDPDPPSARHRPRAVVCDKNKYHLSPKFRKVEQNVLCTRPDVRPAVSTPSMRSEQPSDPGSPRSRASLKTSSSDLHKCKCKDNRDRRPCICTCTCKEEVIIYDSDVEPVISVSPSSRSELIYKECMQVQTSFPSSIAPCNLNTCPRLRKKKFVHCRAVEMQTDPTDIEWQTEPPVTHPRRTSINAFKIPPKRTEAMDDRLLRRIVYFDCRKSSVASKNVHFCTYDVKKMGFPKNQSEKVPCSDCPGSRKCNLVLCQNPYHLTCNEIVIVINSLELNQEGVDSLRAVCSFLYIDYVFLGHVGNETNLAPVSNNVLFDSRKSFSLSLRFNKKERSILREQVNPTGLLVKDTIMFLVVTQAAPECGINKNRDFGFGYLSMKQISEQMGSEDKMCTTVEMQRIAEGRNKIGRLRLCIEGLKAIKTIKNESLSCAEPHVDAMMKKLQLNKKELIAAENGLTTCKRRISKNTEQT